MAQEVIKFTVPCQACNGTGVYQYKTATGETVIEDPCTRCGGDGVRTIERGMDATKFNEIIAKLDAIQTTVDEIKKKLK